MTLPILPALQGMPGMPPSNGSYFVAAYVAAAVIYFGYALTLIRRRAATRRALDGFEGR